MEFYSKNKFEKLVHLVGFIIRIFYDAGSSERQMNGSICIVISSSTLLAVSLCISPPKAHSAILN